MSHALPTGTGAQSARAAGEAAAHAHERVGAPNSPPYWRSLNIWFCMSLAREAARPEVVRSVDARLGHDQADAGAQRARRVLVADDSREARERLVRVRQPSSCRRVVT